jgi:hypothetical protein
VDLGRQLPVRPRWRIIEVDLRESLMRIRTCWIVAGVFTVSLVGGTSAARADITLDLNTASPGLFTSLTDSGFDIERTMPPLGDQPLVIDLGGGNIALGDSVPDFTATPNGSFIFGAPITVRRADKGVFRLTSFNFANLANTTPSFSVIVSTDIGFDPA